jgi:amino acid adenylation domain-containing protein/non-ribosomal peptide synthase protein (TIGR01720 family)
MFKTVDENMLLSSPGFLKQKEYWLNKLSGDIADTTVTFAGKKTTPSRGDRDIRRDRVKILFPGHVSQQLLKLSKASDLSIYIILLAGLKLLIHRYTYNEDITVVSPLHRLKISGSTINSRLFIRDRVNDGMVFKELILNTRVSVLEAYDNQDYPFNRLMEYLEPSNLPDRFISNIACSLSNIHAEKNIEELNNDINISLSFSFLRDENNFSGEIVYDANHCENYYIQQMAVHFINLLENAAQDVEIEISRISILSEEERNRLLTEFNDTWEVYPEEKTIQQLFEEQVEKRKDHRALVFNSEQLSYGEVNQKANRLAGELRERGVRPDTIVALMVDRSTEMIVGILGILKAGGAYLPLESEFPKARIRYMLTDTGTQFLVTRGKYIAEASFGIDVIDIEGNEIHKREVENPEVINEPDDLAYIIYTSGTTGKPKGVLATHFNVIRVVKNSNYIDLRAEDRLLQLSNYAFDGSVFDIYGALLNGAALVMIEREHVLAVERLSELIKRERISVFFVTTALFNALVDVKLECFVQVRKVLFGGERVSVKHTWRALEYLGEDRIIHVYGPTETTVYATYYFIDQIDKRAGTIPIGKPISSTTIYILNKYLKPVPVGITGEIFIGGTGTSRGYLNAPELTKERFIASPFNEVERLYRTGDLACWLVDGNVEFSGRLDHQIKIRGYRVELGEIESRLQKHEQIKDAVVTVREEAGSDDKFLCAYVAFKEENTLSVPELRKYIARELPDYMIPSHFVLLDDFALTAGGKIDRQNLPDPEKAVLISDREYTAPRNSIELELAEIFNNVLGRRATGIHDNFFEIGGDSIRAIQIVSRMNQAGYKIEVAEIFQHPTISELAPQVRKVKKTAVQDVITGVVPLAPNQKAFFAGSMTGPHHFNQAMLLYSKEEIDEDAVKAAFKKIQEHHDALRMVFQERNGEMIQINKGLEYPISLQVYDFRNRENGVTAVEEEINTIQSNLDLENGPLMKGGLFHLDDGDRLLIVIHHLVVDAVSWRILLEDIDILYRQYNEGGKLTLPLKTDSFKLWSEKLWEYAGSEAFLAEKAYWMELESKEVAWIRQDFPGGDNYFIDTETLSFALGEAETALLSGQANEAFGTEVNDLLLTALGLAVKEIFANNRLFIALEGDGREEILKDLDVSRTVGWFENIYLVLLDFSYENNLPRQVVEVKESLRQVPRKGIGYGILKYLTPGEHKKGIDFQLKPQISFKYSHLRQYPEQMLVGTAVESVAKVVPPKEQRQREYELEAAGSIRDERLEMSIAYNKKQYKRETIQTLLNRYEALLRHVISCCSAREKRELTPSDLTYKKLSLEELERLKEQFTIEDIYGLTPLQEGMLFHAIYQMDIATDFVQISYRLHGRLELELVERSLNDLFKRHEILRTAFVYESVRQPLQVVMKDRQAEFYFEDIRNKPGEAEKENYVKEFIEKDRRHPFDLSKDVLMRVSIIQLDNKSYEFVWSFHHILMDGWCMGIIVKDFFEFYNSCKENRASQLPPVRPYRSYIEWLAEQDKKESQRYWAAYLESYHELASIPKMKSPQTAEAGYANERVIIGLDRERTNRLSELAGKNRATVNVMFQTLWGILLSRYAGKRDVVFGAVVSGRPSELEGVETMVGLFINTVPVRVRIPDISDKKITFDELVQRVQKAALESEPHHYYPLANIQSQSALKQHLLDHIIAFENFPIEEQIDGIIGAEEQDMEGAELKVSNIESFGQSNYDFNLVVYYREELQILFLYNGNVYKKRLIERISEQFEKLIDQVLVDDRAEVGQLAVLGEKERSELVEIVGDESELLFTSRFLKQKEYWLDKLSGDIAKTEIVFAGKRSQVSHGVGEKNRMNIHFPEQLFHKLIKLSKQSDLSLYILLLVGLKSLIYRYTNNEDIVIVSPLRHVKVSGETINNRVLIRDRVDGKTTFKEFILNARRSVLEAYGNQDYPVEKLMEYLSNVSEDSRGLQGKTLSDIACSLRNIHDDKNIEELSQRISLSFSFLMEDDHISGDIVYDADGYEAHYIGQMAEHFVNLLENAVRDVETEVAKISFLSREGEKRLLEEFNNTREAYPADKTIQQLFAEQVGKRKEYPALVFDKKQLSYEKVNRKANRLARELREKGVRPDTGVGLIVERSFEMVIGKLGILKAGGAYVPIDPEYPQERIKYILDECHADILLIQSHLNPNGIDFFKGEIIPLDVDVLVGGEDKENNDNNIEDINKPDDLAYVMYTSGSTGRPKGVMVEHGNVVRLVKSSNVVELNEDTRILQTGAPVFDATTFEMWGSLLNGGILYLAGNDVILDAHRLGQVLRQEKITTLWLSSPLFNQLVWQDSHMFSDLEYLIVGGDVLSPKHINMVRNTNKQLKVINGYGPTENTTFSTFYLIDKDFSDQIPIGHPIKNSTGYILDRDFQLQPIGILGELCVGGDGVSRGYLNSPEMTGERFIPDPFAEGGRMYRTGDLACWLPDGDVKFFGRKDHQIKIRGYRVELGEIESYLHRHEQIKDAVVTAREESESGNKFLCAYVAFKEEYTLSVPELREYISRELPDYMIPSHFVLLDDFALTAGGKIDRQNLPDPEKAGLRSDGEYAAPRNSIELKLEEICNNVLSRSATSIHDNFFEIGGDSIKAIQIASRMHQAGYKIDVADIFQYPTIAELALRVKKWERTTAQEPVTGVVPLTPSQQAFFTRFGIASHHFKRAVLLYSREEINEGGVKAVFTEIQVHHDALRMVYRKGEEKVIQTNKGLEHPLSLQVYDYRSRENAAEAMEDEINTIYSDIDLENGPLMKLGLFHLDDGDRLLIVIHPLVMDAVSWDILLEDLETLYGQYKKGDKLVLPLKTDSFKAWLEKLSEYAGSGAFLAEKAYWKELASKEVPVIKKDFSGEDNFIKHMETLGLNLNEEETGQLSGRANEAFGTEVNDLLLTALGLAIKSIFGNDRVLIDLEGDGRKGIVEELDVSRTVGCFTGIYPVVLDFSYEADLSRQIVEVKESIRRVPHKGMGYGILTYLTAEEHKSEIGIKLEPQISFRYRHPLQLESGAEQKQEFFETAEELTGHGASPEAQREYELEVFGSIKNKRMEISISYSKAQYKSETIQKLLNRWEALLNDLISYCTSREKKELTPSDFTYRQLSIEELERLKREYIIEDIYGLTPLQEGMLFHALYQMDVSTDFVQNSYRLQGELDLEIVKKSLNELFKRHDILRTVFVYEGLRRPLQVVLEGRQVDFYTEDIRQTIAEPEKEKYVKEFIEKDRRRAFNLSKDALMRVSVIQSADESYEFTWSFHHILMDGWCMAIIMREFFELYTAYRENRPYRLPAVIPYRRYIEWLERRDKSESQRYWAEYLDSYEEFAGIPRVNSLNTLLTVESGYAREEVVFSLTGGKTGRLNELAGKSHVTVNTVVQTLWGILLAKYAGRNDVVFGAIVSGRPSELEGVESILGLFINTIPVRIRINDEEKTTFKELLQSVQKTAIESEPHHYYPLARIQAENPLKNHLLDHIIAFENFPIEEQIEGIIIGDGRKGGAGDLRVSDARAFGQTNYDFNVVIGLLEQMVINFIFNGNVYQKQMVERIARHFEKVVDHVIAGDDLEIEDITLLSEEEKRQILFDFNNTYSEYPGNKAIHQLFEEQVEKRKDNLALVFNKEELSYIDVNRKANRLAGELRAKGVTTDTIVGIIEERSFEMIVGILGILKAGGAYLPIDPEYPQERIEFILNDCNVNVLFIQSRLGEREFFNKERIENIPLDLGTLGGEENDDINIENVSKPGDLAYVMYTSGSTGRPRGVMVEHRSVVRLVRSPNVVELTEETRILQTGAPVFDATTFEIWGSLLNGGVLCLVDSDGILDAKRLGQLLVEEKINTLWLTSPLFNQLAWQDSHIFSNLEYLIVGGDALSPKHINRVRNTNKSLKIINGYGPTENTTFSTFYHIDKDFAGQIPIGKPVKNSTTYVLDRYSHLQPIGILGELYTGGDGVARGYLNNPGLTEERFIENPFAAGDRLYKTGDLARWMPDGNVEFFGRVDFQVKIRGYRVEPGEIENHLQKHERVKDAVVIVKKDANSENKFLCAYITFQNESALSVPELREYLSKELPDYMIPSHFVVLDEFVLTTTGKIDRQNLPDPEKAALKSDVEYAAPGNSIEMKLVEIWQHVLEREHIGINDDFFVIGGDSIRAIQIASRMNQAGYKLDVANIFQYPTISELAPKVKTGEKSAAQDAVTGIVPLTPGQRTFFARSNARIKPHHFNRAVLLYSREEIDEDGVKGVFTKIQEHHDALRMLYQQREGEVNQTTKGLDHPLSLQVYDYRSREDARKAMEVEIDGIQTGIDLENGPLMKVGLFHLDDGDRLLIVIHQLIMDAVSWGILLEDLDTLYGQYKKGDKLVLPLKTDSFKDWSEKLPEYADSEEFLAERAYWMALESGEAAGIKKDFSAGDNYIKDVETLLFHLDEKETGDLLTRSNEAFGTEVNDLLLTALGLAIKAIFGNDRVLIALEGDSRKGIVKDLDVSRTVGCFTGIYPVVLDFSYEDDLSRQIVEVKESIRQVPHKGIGYGILQYLTAEEHKREIDFKLKPHISFKYGFPYSGSFDPDAGQMPFEIAGESTGHGMSPEEQREYELEVSGTVKNKQLEIAISYSKKQYRSQTIEVLLDHYKNDLKNIIAYCLNRDERELTPSDFTYSKLSVEDIKVIDSLFE